MEKTILEMLQGLENNGGFTLKKGKSISYVSGWQVATNGIETTDIETARKAIEDYNGNCGVWFADGVYYVDQCKRVATKKLAMEIGKACKQISIFGWKRQNLAFC